jgi:hypothetical protein
VPRFPAWSVEVEPRLTRRKGRATQSAWWPLSVPRGDLSCDDSYSICTLDTHRALKSFGRIRLRLSGTGSFASDPVPAVCSGSSETRRVHVAGALSFLAHGFGELRAAARQGALTVSSLDCVRRTSEPCHETTLASGGHAVSFVIAESSGPGVTVDLRSHPWALSETKWTETRVTGLARHRLSIAPDLAMATFDFRGVPFFRGRLVYTASGPAKVVTGRCGPTPVTDGWLGGSAEMSFAGDWGSLVGSSSELYREP